MTLYTPTFSVSDYELYRYTDPYLTPDQQTAVAEVETRVEGQLDFLAQMLGWSGPNYWGNLPSSPDQKRQLLGGTYGVYNSYIIPTVYQIQNWDNAIIIEPLPFLVPGRSNQVARIRVGEEFYQITAVEVIGSRYKVSVGSLPESFYTEVENGTPILIDVPSFRPAPFYRNEIGISGNASFVCGIEGNTFTLYPGYDKEKKFPVFFPIFFRNAIYLFDTPVYLANDAATLSPILSPEYDETLELWSLDLRNAEDVLSSSFLVAANQNADITQNPYLPVTLINWFDPSDWGAPNVLDYYRGVWNNKGGALPYNFVFDALSIHGCDERGSIALDPVQRDIDFNDIVNFIYYQKTTISSLSPPAPSQGDLWWNDTTGTLAVWLPDSVGCSSWVEIDYRQSPRLTTLPTITYPDVATFQANVPTLLPGDIIRIDNIQGLSLADNVIGIGTTLTTPGAITMYLDSNSTYWVPLEFSYANVTDFTTDALSLPPQVPVRLLDASGLTSSDTTFEIGNLPITITGQYEVILEKFYTEKYWEIFPDSILKYIAFSSLFGSPQQGEMWWDFANADPDTRAAAIYYQSAWVGVNTHPQSGPPAPALDLSVILFYADGNLLTPGQDLLTDSYMVSYSQNPATGTYEFLYNARNFQGMAQLPTITISDSLTTTYRADITSLVFSGLTYHLSASVTNAETPLRLWKSEALQCVDDLNLISQNNYINPLMADLNTGPGPTNWERYFIRLPLEYERNGVEWEKVALIAQDFGYWGSSVEPEEMRCPPEDDRPVIYEELFLYDQPIPDYTYVYAEPYLYSNIAYFNNTEIGNYRDAGIFPVVDLPFDEFTEAQLISYEPLHNRLADTTSPVGQGFGDWKGAYYNINPCIPLTGHLTTDLVENGLDPVSAPIWDASIYKAPPTCQASPRSYDVDANHYKICYSYFVADASAAEDPFFDLSQEPAWRYPATLERTSYLTPR